MRHPRAGSTGDRRSYGLIPRSGPGTNAAYLCLCPIESVVYCYPRVCL